MLTSSSGRHHYAANTSINTAGSSSSMPIRPMAVFRHIPHSASIDHALVTSLAFSSCGLHHVAASRDRTLRLYDVGAVVVRDAYIVNGGPAVKAASGSSGGGGREVGGSNGNSSGAGFGPVGCERVVFTHSSDVVAFTPSNTEEAPIYLLNLSTGRLLSGVSDIIGGGGGITATGSQRRQHPLRRAFPNAVAFKKRRSDRIAEASEGDSNSNRASTKNASLFGDGGDGDAPPNLVTLPTAASTCLAHHPTMDIIASVRKDGWAQLCVPSSVGRPLAVLQPTAADEAYAKARRVRMAKCAAYGMAPNNNKGNSNTLSVPLGAQAFKKRKRTRPDAPVGKRASSVPISLTNSDGSVTVKKEDEASDDDEEENDNAASTRDGVEKDEDDSDADDYYDYDEAFANSVDCDGFYGMSSSSTANTALPPPNTTVWFDHDGDHPFSTASFSPCGTYLAVARSTSVAIYDLRYLGGSVGGGGGCNNNVNGGGGPLLRVMDSASLFSTRGRFEHDPPSRDRDVPVLSSVQLASGGIMLATATTGLSTIVDSGTAYPTECDYNNGVRVLYQLDGGGYPQQYFAAANEDALSASQQYAALQGGGGGGGGGGGMMMGMGWGAGGGANAVSGANSPIFAYPAPVSCGARFLTPSEGLASMVLQPAARRGGGGESSSAYPLLIYQGVASAFTEVTAGGGGREAEGGGSPSHLSHFNPPSAGSVAGTLVLSHQLVPRDVGPTQATAVNPRFAMMASAANTVQWWGLGEGATLPAEEGGRGVNGNDDE